MNFVLGRTVGSSVVRNVCMFTVREQRVFMNVNTQTKAVISLACVAVWFEFTFFEAGGGQIQHRMQNLQFWNSLLKIKFYLYTNLSPMTSVYDLGGATAPGLQSGLRCLTLQMHGTDPTEVGHTVEMEAGALRATTGRRQRTTAANVCGVPRLAQDWDSHHAVQDSTFGF